MKDAVKTYENKYQQTAITFNDTSDQVLVGGIDNDIKARGGISIHPYLLSLILHR